MKILFSNTLYSPYFIGGAEKSLEYLCSELVKLGHEVVVISTHDQKTKIDFVDGVKIYYLKSYNVYWQFDKKSHGVKLPLWHLIDSYNVVNFFRFRNILKCEKPDVYVSNNLGNVGVFPWVVSLWNNLRTFHIVRDFSTLSIDPSLQKVKNRFLSTVLKFVFRGHYNYLLPKLNGVIFISEFMKIRYESYLDDGLNSYILHNPIIKPQYVSDLPVVNRENSNTITLGYMGRLSDEKGIFWLLDALRCMPESRFKYELFIAGDYSGVTDISSQYGSVKVHWLGIVKPKDFFNQVDILIVPSIWEEPFGRVVIESYSHGRPVIYSKVGGIPEIALNFEQVNVAFSHDNPSQFYNSIEDLSELVKQDAIYIKQACVKHSRNFNCRNQAMKLLEIIEHEDN